jgi:hypothetical protein
MRADQVLLGGDLEQPGCAGVAVLVDVVTEPGDESP